MSSRLLHVPPCILYRDDNKIAPVRRHLNRQKLVVSFLLLPALFGAGPSARVRALLPLRRTHRALAE
jgi:hypothetical protein